MLGMASSVHGQAPPTIRDSLIVTLVADTTRYLAADETIGITLNRALDPDEGQLVLLVGSHDVTALAERGPRHLTYRPTIEPLPAGSKALVVYRRHAGQWTELYRATLKVLTRSGFRRVNATPQATLGNKGQLASGEYGLPAPERPTYQDFSLNGSVATTGEHERFTLETAAGVVGSSRHEEALRYGLRQDRAPRLDLSEYRIALRAGGTALTVGHTSFGESRHLVNGFGSRGARLSWTRGATQVGVAALGASSTVGWDQLLPVANGNHRVLAASLGREVVPERPGALRVDATWLDASMLPCGRPLIYRLQQPQIPSLQS
jgi:hypothetical protein